MIRALVVRVQLPLQPVSRAASALFTPLPQAVSSALHRGNAGIPPDEASQLRYLIELARVAPNEAAGKAELRAVLGAGGALDALAAVLWDGAQTLSKGSTAKSVRSGR